MKSIYAKLGVIGISIIALFSLTSCGFGGNDDDAAKSEKNIDVSSGIFDIAEFSIKFPNGWEVITPKDFTTEIPVGTFAGFLNSVKNESFTANFVVGKSDLPEPVPAIDYSKALLQQQGSSLVDFKEISKTEINIPVAGEQQKTLFMHFSGRETADADMKEFLQLLVVKGKTVYLATGAFLENEDEGIKKQIEDALKTLVIK